MILNLEDLSLTEDADITRLLGSFRNCENLKVDFGSSLKRLRCDFVEFDLVNVSLFGNCELMQSDRATQPTILQFNKPQNVHIGSGLTFRGSTNESVKLRNSNDCLVRVSSTGRGEVGGQIVSHANYVDSVGKGFGVFLEGSKANAYESIDIVGKFINCGSASNASTRYLKIDVYVTDPYSRAKPGTPSSKVLSTEFGRVISNYSVKIVSKYGGGGFGFKLDEAVGNVNLTAIRHGYLKDGTPLNRKHAGQIFKTDTQGPNSHSTIEVIQIDCDNRPYKVSLEASPGPTNKSQMRLDGPSLFAELSVLQNDGKQNYENYGNRLMPGSSCQSVKIGSASRVEGSQVNVLRMLDSDVRVPSIVSTGSVISDTKITGELYVSRGCHVQFADKTFIPKNVTIRGEGRTVLTFDDCTFQGTKFLPASWDEFFVGLNGGNAGLDTSNIPASSIPYLLLDSVSHPDSEDVIARYGEGAIEKIVNPAGSATGEVIRYSGSKRSPTSLGRIVNIDKERAIGNLVFPYANTNNGLGSYHSDLGVDEGVCEMQFQFRNGGSEIVGVFGRGVNDLEMLYLYLDFSASTINFRCGNPNSTPYVTAVLETPLSYDTTYKIKLEIHDACAKGYLDDVLLIDDAEAVNAGETHWGYRSRLKDGSVYDNAIGPTIDYLMVRPIADSTSANASEIEKERRTL